MPSDDEPVERSIPPVPVYYVEKEPEMKAVAINSMGQALCVWQDNFGAEMRQRLPMDSLTTREKQPRRSAPQA